MIIPTMVILDTFPGSHEADYTVRSSQPLGERALAHIAAESAREYLWTFTDSDQLWRNHTVSHFDEHKYRKGVLERRRLGFSVPENLLIPNETDVSIYHNHPTAPDHFDHGRIKAQLPSSEDILSCVKLSINGYKDFRIVTELGVTALTLNASAKSKDTITIKGFDLKPRQMQKWEKRYGIVGAIHQASDFFTDRFDDQINVSFHPFSDIQ